MQFSALEIRFIVTTYLNSTFTNDLKRKYFFSKMFIVTDYAALKVHKEKIIFFILNQNICCGYSKEPKHMLKLMGKKNIHSFTL